MTSMNGVTLISSTLHVIVPHSAADNARRTDEEDARRKAVDITTYQSQHILPRRRLAAR